MNLKGGIPVVNSRTSSGAMIGKTISAVASRLISFQAATVVSSYSASNKTLVALDVAPDDPIGALSMTGRLAQGQRVMVAFYPPRGCLVLGRIESGIGDPGLIALTTPGVGQLFTASMVPAGAVALKVMCQAAGGGGGGSTTAVGTEFSPGAGGAGGSLSVSTYPVESFMFPCEYDIGLAGAAGASGGGSGGVGDDTRFSIVGSTFTPQVLAVGGGGGSGAGAGTSFATSTGGVPGSGSVGQMIYRGSAGRNGVRNGGAVASGFSGAGGDSPMGTGGREPIGNNNSSNSGAAGVNYGAAGSGAKTAGAAAGAAGGAGAAGAIFIEPIFG